MESDDNKNIPPILLYSYCFFRYGFFTRPGLKKPVFSKIWFFDQFLGSDGENFREIFPFLVPKLTFLTLVSMAGFECEGGEGAREASCE